MSGDGDGEMKPGQSLHINLKVKSQNGNEVFFRIKRTTRLKKLMDVYCDRECLSVNSVAFLYAGRRLQPEQTPLELWLDDGDEIDAMIHQIGGGGGGGF